jgi:hypothetical protein
VRWISNLDSKVNLYTHGMTREVHDETGMHTPPVQARTLHSGAHWERLPLTRFTASRSLSLSLSLLAVCCACSLMFVRAWRVRVCVLVS